MKKLIDLPDDAIKKLSAQAKKKRMKLKPYIEVVLIDKSKGV